MYTVLDLQNHYYRIREEYHCNDDAHGVEHLESVETAAFSLLNSPHFADAVLNRWLLRMAVVYHDCTVHSGREDHGITAAKRVRNHEDFLLDFFSEDDIEVIAQAVEDHRASKGSKPRSIYGVILSDADKVGSIEDTVKRCYQYRLHYSPELSDAERYADVKRHLKHKYGTGGYAKFWLPETNKLPQVVRRREVADDPEGNNLRGIYESVIGQPLRF